MTSVASINAKLLKQVLETARTRGIDQTQLAEDARLKPETLSRAKKRADMNLSTISRLAAVVGLQVVLQPVTANAGRAPEAPISRTAALSKAQFGLAWSNPGAEEGVLLRNALLQGRFNAILEAAAQDGIPFVRRQMEILRESGETDESQNAKLERIISSIERGFAEVNDHATA